MSKKKLIDLPKENKIYIRFIRKRPVIGYTNKQRKKLKNKGIIYIPDKELIGKLCIVCPITKSQAAWIKQDTIGLKRARKFMDTLIKNPRSILDSVGNIKLK